MSEDLKKTSTDTPSDGETTETQGTVDKSEETTVTPEVKVETPQEEMVSKKELDKAVMRQNQLENQITELSTAAQGTSDEELEVLREKATNLENQIKDEKQAKSQEEEKSLLKGIRADILSKYPEQKETLEALINKNDYAIYPVETYAKLESGEYSYSDGTIDSYRFDKARREEIEGQVETLAGSIVKAEEPEIKVEMNNPGLQPDSNRVEISDNPREATDSELDYLSGVADDSFEAIGAKRNK